MPEKMRGVIRTINKDKGFGFITTPKGGGDWFFHRSGLASDMDFLDLYEQQNVEFDPNPHSPKGPRAENVRVIE
jgi:cold shock CspA family protein